MKMQRLADMYEQPGYLIRRTHQTATAAFASATKDLDLTAVQFSALVAIKDHPEIDATRVSDVISFDRTTIGHVLGRLEQKGLITRQEGTEDKRTKVLRITPRGKEMIAQVTSLVPSISETILGPLSASERTTLLHLLAKLNAAG